MKNHNITYDYKKFFEKLFYALLITLIFVPILQIPIYYISNFDWYLNYNLFIESIAQISLICLIIFILYNTYKDKKFIFNCIKNNKSLIFLIIFLICVFISSILSKDLSLAFHGSDYRHEGFFMYIYYTVFFLISLSIKDYKKKINLAKIISICATLISIMVIYQYINPFNDRYVSTNLTGVFFHFNHLGYYFSISTIVTSVLIVINNDTKKSIFYSILMTIQVSALVINDTFGAYLAILISLFLLILIFKLNKDFINTCKSNFIIFIPILIFIVVTVFFNILGIGHFIDNFSSLFSDINSLFSKIFGFNTSSYKKHEESTGTARIELWKAAIKFSLNNPILGSGLEQLAPYYKDLGFIQTKPANEYIYILASSGFPAFIFYITWLVKILASKLKKLTQLSNIELLGFLCSLSYLISAFFGNSTFYITPYFLMFLAFI